MRVAAQGKLTDVAIRSAKPKEKPYKLFDGVGLYLEVTPAGGKLWRLKYRHEGKEKRLALGAYPVIGLKAARERATDAKRLLADGIDPARTRAQAAGADSFEVVAREWHAKFAPKWTAEHADRIIKRLALNVFPWLGSKPVGSVTAPELLAVLRRIEARGRLETAHRAHQNCGAVFRYAVATGRAERDPSGDLRGALPPVAKRHHAAIVDPKAAAELLRAIEGYTGSFVTACALKLAPLVFVRPGELRRAEWTEIDLEAGEWRIPPTKMKAREAHVVPLSRQAVAILSELRPLTGSGRYVFTGARSAERPMSENTVNAALRRLGYDKDVMTGHGFRTLASTVLHEQGWPSDIVERQLAHAERNKVKAAYNRAQHLPERRKMMQQWADYLDDLRAGGPVVAMRRPLA